MSTRISSALAGALLLAACDGSPPDGPAADDGGSSNTAAIGAPRIACARGGGAFADTCTVEMSQDRDGTMLVVREADGGFHRFRLTPHGRGLVAADGAQPAIVQAIANDLIEVAIGNARYRLPATVASRPK